MARPPLVLRVVLAVVGRAVLRGGREGEFQAAVDAGTALQHEATQGDHICGR